MERKDLPRFFLHVAIEQAESFMRTATLLLAALGPAPFLLPASLAQPKPPSRDQLKQMETERKATIKDLSVALRDRCSDDAAYQMRVLMRLYFDDKGAQEIAREMIKVLEGRFPCDGPKLRALDHLKELGDPGIQELEKALLSRLRTQPVPLQLRAISTLVEASRPDSYDTLVRLSRDKNQIIAVAAVQSLTHWKQISPEARRDLAQKVLQLMRPPTAEEIEKDLELPPLQRALRDVLADLTGKRVHTLPDWQKHVACWIREGCPLPPCAQKDPCKKADLADEKPGAEKPAPKDGQPKEGQKVQSPPAENGPQAQTVKSIRPSRTPPGAK